MAYMNDHTHELPRNATQPPQWRTTSRPLNALGELADPE
jgi:hypothetical protein